MQLISRNLKKALLKLSLLSIALVFSLACAGKDDGESDQTIGRDANNDVISAELRESFTTIPAGTATLGSLSEFSSIPNSTDVNSRTISLSSYQIMNSEITIQMYVDFLNSAIPNGSTATDRSANFHTGMENSFIGGVFRTDSTGGLVVSLTENFVEGSTSTGTTIFDVLGKAYLDPYVATVEYLDGRQKPRQQTETTSETTTGVTYNVSPGRANHPIIFIDKSDCFTFAEWLGFQYRLPTEDEWEFAAKGGIANGDFPTATGIVTSGNTIEEFQTEFHSFATFQGNFAEPGTNSATTPVKSYPSNNFGLYDMAGNVYEWTLISETETQSVSSMLKGGSWNTKNVQDMAVWQRVGPFTATVAASDLGFRLVFIKENFTTVAGSVSTSKASN